jgi:hypothetical protein
MSSQRRSRSYKTKSRSRSASRSARRRVGRSASRSARRSASRSARRRSRSLRRRRSRSRSALRSASRRSRSARRSRSRSRSRSNEPSDKALYQSVKARIYKQVPKHSAYRSGLVVKAYKAAFKRKHGNSRQPYRGSRSRSRGLGRWFAEKWVNQRGEVGYKYKSDIYRPSRRVTQDTPKTYRELSPSAIRRARSKKSKTGRVDRF